MRYFRIPNFRGVEGHRNKPDRGTLRALEGCIPYPVGGLRSGPVWTSLGTPTGISAEATHLIKHATDNLGNVFLLVVQSGEIYAIHAFPASLSTPKIGTSIADQGDITSSFTDWLGGRAYSSNIGSRQVAIGNGGANPHIVDMTDNTLVTVDVTDSDIYKQSRTAFPKCTMFVRGPNKCLFAAGNPDSKLTVYISEPAGSSAPQRDSLYATGSISSVDLLMTDATTITALSVLGPYVVVHTDYGVSLLYQTNPDQAESGFRTEQVASPVSSAAINHRVVGGQQNQPFFLGRDGQIYKDESTTSGPDGKPMYSDPRQASWKAKGLWSAADINADDISTAFAAYDPGVGMYFVFLPTKEAE